MRCSQRFPAVCEAKGRGRRTICIICGCGENETRLGYRLAAVTAGGLFVCGVKGRCGIGGSGSFTVRRRGWLTLRAIVTADEPPKEELRSRVRVVDTVANG